MNLLDYKVSWWYGGKHYTLKPKYQKVVDTFIDTFLIIAFVIVCSINDFRQVVYYEKV